MRRLVLVFECYVVGGGWGCVWGDEEKELNKKRYLGFGWEELEAKVVARAVECFFIIVLKDLVV